MNLTKGADLIAAIRAHFAFRCGLLLPKEHRYYTTIGGTARKAGMTVGKVKRLLVSEESAPTFEEFDRLLQALNITLADLEEPATATALPARPSKTKVRQVESAVIKPHVESILSTADRMLTVVSRIGQPHAALLTSMIGWVQGQAEQIAKLAGVVRFEEAEVRSQERKRSS